jgi:hypothetical protein
MGTYHFVHFVFSSPDPSRYSEHLKSYAHVMYNMPVWSEGEMTDVWPNKEVWLEMFKLLEAFRGRCVLKNRSREIS